MSELNAIDHRDNPAKWAEQLKISAEAVHLYLDSEVVDLHNDHYVPVRLYGYNPHKRHGLGLTRGYFVGQSDLPRLREARLTCTVFDIATNPLRRAGNRAAIAHKNIERITADLLRHPTHFRLVKNHSQFLAAREKGLMGCYIGIQGGQAFQHSRETMEAIPDIVHRITLVHLTNSQIGTTSSPLGKSADGLTSKGRELVEIMNHKRILVDLAHIDRPGFMHAAQIHDKSQPLICTHTGVLGMREHWRNIDDEQILTVTDTGGTIGIMFQSSFLDDTLTRCNPERVLDHMEHVISVAGDECVSIGTDYDGMIIPPHNLRQVTDMPRLVQLMLDRNWSEQRIRRILGLNALRVFKEIRP
jgi:membrane dipeptidase